MVWFSRDGRGWDEAGLFGQQQPVVHQGDRGVLAAADAEQPSGLAIFQHRPI
jgi:hypothetical protein